MRQFEVAITVKGKKTKYPPMGGNKALALMERLTQRGFSPLALTNANGVDDVLTLNEMKEIYEDFLAADV